MTKTERMFNKGVKAFSLAGKFYDIFSGSELAKYQGLFCLDGHFNQIMKTWIDGGERHFNTV